MKIIHKKSFSDMENYTVQYKMELDDGYRIYVGFWKKRKYEDIISVTTQVGCKTQCALFCNVEKYIRDINSDELIYQIENIIEKENLKRQNVKVSMVKEGEPFDNIHILDLIRNIDLLGIPYLKISTSVPSACEDIIRQVFCLAEKLNLEIQLQISLSSTDDQHRNMYVARDVLTLIQISHLGKEIYEKIIKRNKKYNYITLSFTLYEESPFDIDEIKKYFDSNIFCIRLRDASNSNTRGKDYTRITERTFLEYKKQIEKAGFIFIDGRSAKIAVDNDLTIGLYKLGEVLS